MSRSGELLVERTYFKEHADDGAVRQRPPRADPLMISRPLLTTHLLAGSGTPGTVHTVPGCPSAPDHYR